MFRALREQTKHLATAHPGQKVERCVSHQFQAACVRVDHRPLWPSRLFTLFWFGLVCAFEKVWTRFNSCFGSVVVHSIGFVHVYSFSCVSNL